MEMKSIMLSLFLLQTLINVANSAKVLQLPPVYKCRNTGNNASINYKFNIVSAIKAVSKNIGAHNGFYHSSSGTTTEQVNAIGLCPNYVKPQLCELCVKNSINLLHRSCPIEKEGVVWVENCMVRYSGRKINGVLDDWVWVHLSKEPIESILAQWLDEAVYDLAKRLQTQAAEGNSLRKFASGNLTYRPDLKVNNIVYAVMQCTPDLSKEQCSKCLHSTILNVHSCCSGKKNVKMLCPNCYFRYAHDEFAKTQVFSTPS